MTDDQRKASERGAAAGAIGDIASKRSDLIKSDTVSKLIDLMISDQNSTAAEAVGSTAVTRPDLVNANIINILFAVNTSDDSYEAKAIAAIGFIATARPLFITNLTIDKLSDKLKNNDDSVEVKKAAAKDIGSIEKKRSDLITPELKNFLKKQVYLVQAVITTIDVLRCKLIRVNFVYKARCGSVFKGKFGNLLCGLKFYDNLIAKERKITTKKTIFPITAAEQESAMDELKKTKDIVRTKDIVCGFLVNVHDVKFPPLFNNVVLVTELPFNSVFNIIRWSYPLPDDKKLDSALKIEIIRDVVSAVSYLHDKDIVHEDINTSNILLFQTKKGKILAKLGGFGVTRYLDHLAIDRVGDEFSNKYTIESLAPDLLTLVFDGKDPVFTKESDIYALGITMNEIMTERPPYPLADCYEYFKINVIVKKQRPILFISNGSQIEDALLDIIISIIHDDVHQPNFRILYNIVPDSYPYAFSEEVEKEEVPPSEKSTSTDYVIQNTFTVMVYVNSNNERTLFVDYINDRFEDKELFLLVKSLRAEEERDDPESATEKAYQYIIKNLLDGHLKETQLTKYVINKKFRIMKDTLGYFSYDPTLLSAEAKVDDLNEDDYIRGRELYIISDMLRDYDQDSEIAYQFINKTLQSTFQKINRCLRGIKPHIKHQKFC